MRACLHGDFFHIIALPVPIVNKDGRRTGYIPYLKDKDSICSTIHFSSVGVRTARRMSYMGSTYRCVFCLDI